MNDQAATKHQYAAQLLATINELTLSAFAANSKKALIFHILNDTARLLPYDRAALWSFEGSQPRLLGVSGQAEFAKNSELADRWKRLVLAIKQPHDSQVLNDSGLLGEHEEWEQLRQDQHGTSVLWVPLSPEEGLVSAILWLERWNGKEWKDSEKQVFDPLAHAYGLAWKPYQRRKLGLTTMLKGQGRAVALGLLLSSMLVRIPLRVVAHAEVVPNDPILVTAPLDGIISEIAVAPGEQVEKGTLLFEYDKRVPLQQLKVAQKQLEITESELHRAMTQGIEDQATLAEYAVLELELQKDRLTLDLAEYEASQLSVHSPNAGVVMLDNPETWRGRPVKVGQRVLMVTDPKNSKVRIWIPEGDNVLLDPEKPIKIFLNVDPTKSLEAKLIYVASFTSVNEQQIPGFEAEAHWAEPAPKVKMGLKGTAILYGENVSLFYYLIRKPWAYLRELIGL